MAEKPVVLIIRDGWGIAPAGRFNAVYMARKTNIDSYLRDCANCVLEASGLAVGLPDGYQGSSEVGHLNMGAGRIVEQELKKIRDLISDGTFFNAPALKAAIDNCVQKGSALHLMGLVQDEGVHAHQDHLFAILRHAAEKGVKRVWVHFFSDGRDTPPRSSLSYIKTLEAKMRETGLGAIATVIGRYYAMDRSEAWGLVDKAYSAIVDAKGLNAENAEEAVTKAYRNDKNPDGSEMSDEYVPPTIIAGYDGVKDGDSVIHFNFRQDRAIELTKAFVDDDYPGKRERRPAVVYCGFTRYYDSFKQSALPPMSEGSGMSNLLGEAISKAGLKQLRIAETQKFKHVTSFFNGKLIKPYEGEERVEIKGTFDPSSYAEHPEMNAYDVADETVRRIKTGKFDFILVNFANCDMVGHTGSIPAAIKAVEVVDDCVGRVVSAVKDAGGVALVTADHGNAEEMWDSKINMPKTAHTCNKVEFMLVGKCDRYKLRQRGILADIAPTVLALLGVPAPKEMTARSLLA